MPKESRSRMQKWPSSTLCPPNSTVTGTTHFYPVAIRSAHVICAQALSFFFVATVALLFFHAESRSQNHLLILAGMAAAFSAWTKNEGVLFLVLLFLLHFVITTLLKGRKSWASEVVPLLKGAVPVGVVILIFKVCLAASDDLTSAHGPESIVRR